MYKSEQNDLLLQESGSKTSLHSHKTTIEEGEHKKY